MKKRMIRLLSLALSFVLTFGLLQLPVLAEEDDPCANGHSYYTDDLQEATCTQNGFARYVCGVCGDIAEEVLPALGHDPVLVFDEEPTCQVEGYREYYCSRCGEFCYDEYVPALGHDPFLDHYDFHPDCENEGLAVYICSRPGCNMFCYYENVPALGHDFEDGFCTRCGALEPGTVVPVYDSGDLFVVMRSSDAVAVLEADISIDDTGHGTVVGASGSVALDLHGHTLSYDIGQDEKAIDVYGDFTLYDSVGGGALISNGFAVYVEEDGEFTMENGEIRGTGPSSTGNPLVYTGVGSFTMNDGLITNGPVGVSVINVKNYDDTYSAGAFTMNGGEISGNKNGVVSSGAAVVTGGSIVNNVDFGLQQQSGARASLSTITLSGSVQIAGNGLVDLHWRSAITIAGPLDPATRVGLTPTTIPSENYVIVIATGLAGNGSVYNFHTNFSTIAVGVDASGELVIGRTAPISFEIGTTSLASGTMESADAAIKGYYVLPECAFTPVSGYEFAGWSDGNNTYAPGDAVFIPSVSGMTFTATFVPAAGALKPGDANGDGVVNVKDVRSIKRHIAGAIPAEVIVIANSDLDGDGVVGMKDLKLLKSRVAG